MEVVNNTITHMVSDRVDMSSHFQKTKYLSMFQVPALYNLSQYGV